MLGSVLAAVIAGFAVGASPQSDPLARAPGTDFRAVVWNVYGFPDRNPERSRRGTFASIFRALDADLLILNEVSGATADVIDALPKDRGRWSWARSGELFVAARGGRRVEPAFERPPLPSAANRFTRLIEWIFGPRTATAIGATVHDAGRRLLVVAVHLPCCANESGRRRDAAAIRGALEAAPATGRADAMVVAGDFNTVRGRAPIDIVQGAAAPGLAALDARHLDGRNDTTWRDDASIFPPARLDWLLYSDRSLAAVRSFVLDAANLDAQTLARHALDRAATSPARTTDHLPIVADFRWR